MSLKKLDVAESGYEYRKVGGDKGEMREVQTKPPTASVGGLINGYLATTGCVCSKATGWTMFCELSIDK
jgi:hypothetical protein